MFGNLCKKWFQNFEKREVLFTFERDSLNACSRPKIITKFLFKITSKHLNTSLRTNFDQIPLHIITLLLKLGPNQGHWNGSSLYFDFNSFVISFWCRTWKMRNLFSLRAPISLFCFYFAVTSVKSARQVIDALNAEGPDIDIILSEVDLPMAKGFKMLKYITRDKDLQRIPVISKLAVLMTSSSLIEFYLFMINCDCYLCNTCLAVTSDVSKG